ncbi:NRT1/ PTR FAMILY 7.1 [Thalictrum thalictroides]|uniref:NRT1/ PTR FAMILY 7.1 n=1 Tax=Thalictrum thalictroides TaxID=46969 RepID=A0A7J6W6M6_THATH|nr:NRT1/ PTR FAMILY 7.1 [Thalictrum thalictroides]
MPTSDLGVGIFYISIYLIALGYGGYQPTIATFGADQFNEADPMQRHSKAVFFCYFYFALNVGSLFSNTILVLFEDRGQWVIGFWASAASAALGIVLFCVGTHGYRYLKPCGNPLTRVAQVFVATFKKWNVTVPDDASKLFEVEGSESTIKGSRKILHSDEIRFLDKAATVTEKDFHGPRNYNPWRLCTITQVQEVKCIMKMLPIWLCTIIYSVVFTQMASLFVEQGDVMNCQLGKFHLPAASMSAFDIMSVLIFTFIYRQLLIPVTGKLTGNPKGLTELQRMGVGLVIGMLAMVAAGITEIERRKYAIPGHETSTLSVFWQIPQYTLVGASEVFMYVGQLDFFNTQAPDGLKSFGSSLCMASISLGNYTSSMLVNMVMSITTKGNRPGWIPINLNSGHMESFYFLISALAAIDFVIYLFCAKWYKCISLENEEGDKMEDQIDDILRRV